MPRSRRCGHRFRSSISLIGAQATPPARRRATASAVGRARLQPDTTSVTAALLWSRQLKSMKSGSDFRRSEEHTSELQSLMRISYAVFCLNKKTLDNTQYHQRHEQNSDTYTTSKHIS